MHERSVARNLLNIVLSQAKTLEDQVKIEVIRIVVGDFTMIQDELLVEAFYQLARSTTAEKAKIEITHSPLKGKCQKCKQEFLINKQEFKCPYCGSPFVQIISGEELFVQDIEISKISSDK
ncbi:MAG: hydrogenase maturation nickel metallochaperone HypA [Candidatus Atribacteria bacterium]|nr:hydrogenase maturation nickel metallochaperone HypA [Candidatus Atribacteria bacterium]